MLGNKDKKKVDVLVPTKSSLSVIMRTDEIWCNFSDDNVKANDSDRYFRDPFIVSGRSIGKGVKSVHRGKKRKKKKSLYKESFDHFTERLMQRYAKKAPMKKLPSRYSKSEKRMKKARQVFTCSRPSRSRNSWETGRLASDSVEVFETTGHLQCDVNEEIPEEFAVPLVVPLPMRHAGELEFVVPNEPDNQSDSASSRITEIPRTGTTIDSKCFPKTASSQPDLFYVISERSLPNLVRRYSSEHDLNITQKQQNVFKTHKKMGLKAADYVKNYRTAFKTICHLSSAPYHQDPAASPSTVLSTVGKAESSEQEQENGKNDTFLMYECQHLNELLAQKIAKTLSNLVPKKGKFMSYAKFNSSFKLSEDFYEDVNCPSCSPMFSDSLARRSFNTYHKVNPDFDENQSITEALTGNRSLSSVTSVTIKSDFISKVCHHLNRTLNEKLQSVKKALLQQQNNKPGASGCKLDEREEEFSVCADAGSTEATCIMDVTTNTWTSLSRVVSAVRKQRLADLEKSFRHACAPNKYETDLWSNTADSKERVLGSEDFVGTRTESNRLLKVVSQMEIFTKTSRPVWVYKKNDNNETVKTDCHKRTKLLDNFVSKAHHYMCDKDYRRSAMTRCYFRARPALKLIDKSVQCPDMEDGDTGNRGQLSQFLVERFECGGTENGTLNVVEVENISNEDVALSMGVSHKSNNIQSLQVCCNYESVQCGNVGSLGFESGDSQGQQKLAAMGEKLNFNASVCKIYSSSTVPNTTVRTDEPVVDEQRGSPEIVSESIWDKSPFNRSFRALCDKRRIRIKYKDGNYTVYKEVGDGRQTVWSMLSGKATQLLSSVMPKKPHKHKPAPRDLKTQR